MITLFILVTVLCINASHACQISKPVLSIDTIEKLNKNKYSIVLKICINRKFSDFRMRLFATYIRFAVL